MMMRVAVALVVVLLPPTLTPMCRAALTHL